jgi:hypothetical protein
MNTAQAQQFATLQKGTATYKNDTKMADHMRRKEADLMSRAIEKNRRDEEELRAVHGEVGEESRKQKNLEMERKRLKEVMECDKLAIQKITQELKIIEVCLLLRPTFVRYLLLFAIKRIGGEGYFSSNDNACHSIFTQMSTPAIPILLLLSQLPHIIYAQTNEKEQKVHFVKEMESLNNENDFILTNCENRKLSHLLDVDNVQWLLEIELPSMLSNMHEGRDDNINDDDDGVNDGIVGRIKDEAAILIEIEGKSEALVEQTTELEILLQQLRTKFTNEHTVSL